MSIHASYGTGSAKNLAHFGVTSAMRSDYVDYNARGLKLLPCFTVSQLEGSQILNRGGYFLQGYDCFKPELRNSRRKVTTVCHQNA